MGEQTVPPKEPQDKKNKKLNEMLTGTSENPTGEENMDTNSENNDNTNEDQNSEEENFEDMSPEEFAALDSQLDALNSALDDIEQKNDDIHAQLLQLLVANREIRRQLQQANSGNSEDQSKNQNTAEPKQ